MGSAPGEIVWVGTEPLGERDGRIALYLTDHLPLLHTPAEVPADDPTLDYLRARGASFFAQLQLAVGGFPNELVDRLWDLVWKGVVTNDTFHALRPISRRRWSRSTRRSRSPALPEKRRSRWRNFL